MPSVSRRQHNYAEMIAHGGKPKKKGGMSVKVAKDFVAADKGRNLKSLPLKAEQEDDSGKGMVISEADYRPAKKKRGRIRAR